MEKTLEQLINDLGLKDYDLFIEEKALEHEQELPNIDNPLYQKARKDYDKNLRKASLEMESSTNWKEWFEYKHMYKSGFKDGLNFVLKLMEILR